MDRKDTKEDDELYQMMFDLKVDFLYADKPMKAMAYREK